MDSMDRSVGKSTTEATSAVSRDEGLRKYMLTIYNFMTSALFITGLTAYLAGSSSFLIELLYNIGPNGAVTGIALMGWMIIFAPVGFVMALSMGIRSFSFTTLQILFWSYSVVMGLSLSSVFLTYTSESIVRVFFITSAVFGSMSLYGYTTKKDLTKIGTFLMMGLFGMFIVFLVNLFLKSSAVQFAASLLVLGIFIGLTAYNTQRYKDMYFQIGSNNVDMLRRVALQAALSLYLDFINIFLYLLRFMGQLRNR